MSSSRVLRVFAAMSLAASVTGCAFYPLPQETSGYTTDQIVNHIRCEARRGLREAVLEWLRTAYPKEVAIWNGYTGTRLADELAVTADWSHLLTSAATGPLKVDFDFYKNSQIAYEFTLTMEEQNIDSANLGLKGLFRSGRIDSTALSAEALRNRKVARRFNVVDTFQELGLKARLICEPEVGKNIAYPITGKLPIADLVRSYIYVNQFSNLGTGGTDSKSILGTKTSPAIPEMGDTITFQTKLSGTANPTFALNPTGLGYLLNTAGFKTDDYRNDMHQVIIVVSTSPDVAKANRLDARIAAPRLDESGGVLGASRYTYVPPSNDGKLSNLRSAYALRTIENQRNRDVQDAIISIGNSLSQLPR